MRAFASSVALATVLACGGGMSGTGSGGGSSDTANQAALDTALQTILFARVRDVCQTRSTCGAAATEPTETTATVEQLRATAHDDPSFAARCRAADAVTSMTGEKTEPRWVIEPDDLYAIGTPPPADACAEVAARLCTPIALELDGACLVGVSSGAGGTVATFAREALETAPHGTSVDGAPTDPLQLVLVAGEPWLISGHAVYRISRDASGRLRADKLADLKDVPTWYRVDGAVLVVQTSDRVVYRVTKRGSR